jgi:hypothetical protein
MSRTQKKIKDWLTTARPAEGRTTRLHLQLRRGRQGDTEGTPDYLSNIVKDFSLI